MPPWEAGNDKWGNMALPDVYAKGTAQLYPTGTIYRKGMRTFIYTKCHATYYGQSGTAAIIAGYLMECGATITCLANSVITGVAGASTIKVDIDNAAYAIDDLGVNSHAGGFLYVQMGAGLSLNVEGGCAPFQIISNTAEDGDGYVTFTLDGTLPVAYDTNSDVVIAEHPYAVVRHIVGDPYVMPAGVLLCTTAASNYLWLQTGGPTNCIHVVSTYEGDAAWCYVCHAHGGACQLVSGYNATTTLSSVVYPASMTIGWRYATSVIVGTARDDSICQPIFLTIFN